MTGLVTILNDLYVDLIWPILTEVDNAYLEPHRQ